MARTIDNRRPVTFEHFFRCMDPDTTIYTYDKEAQSLGLDPWRIIDDWDICLFETKWWDGHKEMPWDAPVWVQLTEQEIKAEAAEKARRATDKYNFRGIY